MWKEFSGAWSHNAFWGHSGSFYGAHFLGRHRVQGGLDLNPFHQVADRRPSTHKHPLWVKDGLILSTGQTASILDVVNDRNGDSGNFSLIIRLPQGSHSDLN